VHSRISWNPSSHERSAVDSEFNACGTFGTRAENNLPGIRPEAMRLSGVYQPANDRVELAITPPRMLTYELRRDSDNVLLMTHVCPYREGVTWLWDLPHLDLNGCHMRVLDGDREIARHQIIDSRTRWNVLSPTTDELASVRTGYALGEWTIDETAPDPTPPLRALEARRNRNTGPAPRPGRVRGNVPGARR
jgi:hypothetical protein